MTPATRRHPWTQSYFQGVLNELLKEPDADKCIAILVSVWEAGGNAANMSQPTLASCGMRYHSAGCDCEGAGGDR